MNRSESWLRSVTSDAEGTVSRRIGVYQSTLSRQLRGDNLTPESIVAISRAYGVSPLNGLIAVGLIAEADVNRAEGASSLRHATDEDLLAELGRRIQVDSSDVPGPHDTPEEM